MALLHHAWQHMTIDLADLARSHARNPAAPWHHRALAAIASAAGPATRSFTWALRVLGRALSAPHTPSPGACALTRAFICDRFGVLGDFLGWPAQRAALQVGPHF